MKLRRYLEYTLATIAVVVPAVMMVWSWVT